MKRLNLYTVHIFHRLSLYWSVFTLDQWEFKNPWPCSSFARTHQCTGPLLEAPRSPCRISLPLWQPLQKRFQLWYNQHICPPSDQSDSEVQHWTGLYHHLAETKPYSFQVYSCIKYRGGEWAIRPIYCEKSNRHLHITFKYYNSIHFRSVHDNMVGIKHNEALFLGKKK